MWTAFLAISLSQPAPASAAMSCPAPIVIAHRGERSLAPENTVVAMTTAVKGGAKVVEFDVRFTRSNIPVLMHDATVDRTTNGTGPVTSLWLYQLQALDAGSHFSPTFANTRVPTFAQVLKAVGPSPGITALAELKGVPTDTQLDIVANAIRNSSMGSRVVVQSFDSGTLVRMKGRHPWIPLAYQTTAALSNPVAKVKAAKANYWRPLHTTVKATNVQYAHAAGIKVWPWTVNSSAEWARLSDLRVDGILTDYSARYAARAAQCLSPDLGTAGFLR